MLFLRLPLWQYQNVTDTSRLPPKNTIKSIYVAGGVSNIMNGLRKERREPNGAPLPTRGEGVGWGIIFLKNKKLHTPPLPLPFMGLHGRGVAGAQGFSFLTHPVQTEHNLKW